MRHSIRICLMTFVALLAMGATSAMAQDGGEAAASGFSLDTKAIGMGLIILGAGIGIGRIGGSAVEAMARQPENTAAIRTAMIIAAALIEGATFFAILMAG
ncbi:MAG: ATP synthase F0 subunit C [Planctomycetaceae bacterium]